MDRRPVQIANDRLSTGFEPMETRVARTTHDAPDALGGMVMIGTPLMVPKGPSADRTPIPLCGEHAFPLQQRNAVPLFQFLAASAPRELDVSKSTVLSPKLNPPGVPTWGTAVPLLTLAMRPRGKRMAARNTSESPHSENITV